MGKISIITINYNNAGGLFKTIQSVINQSYKNIEYVVIDGDSNDGSKEIIEQHRQHLSYVVSEKDSGIYDAMNKGIAKASGEYLLFLNSGDFLNNEKVIEKFIELNPVADIVCGNLIRLDSDGPKLYRSPKPSNISLQTFWNGTISHPSSFIKKKLFEEVGLYDTNYKIVSDWIFFMKAVVLNNASVQQIDLTITQFDTNGISSTQGEQTQLERDKALYEIFPKRILMDYEFWNAYSPQIENFNKIKKFKLLYFSFVLIRKIANFLSK